MATYQLPSNMTRDLKAHRFPQASVKINAVVNKKEIMRRLNLDPSDQARVLFKMDPLEGDMGDAKLLNSDGDPAYIMRNQLRPYPSNEPRTFMNMSNAAPVCSALNGLAGDPDDIEALIEPCGLIEQGNEENRMAQTNVLRGGAHTILYNGVAPARQNSYLLLRVPTEPEADKMMADKASHSRGSKGVVTLMYEEYNPMKTTFFRAEKLYRIFNLGNEFPKHAYGSQAETHAKNLVNSIASLHVLLGGGNADNAQAKVKELIRKAVEEPEDDNAHTFVSTLNTFVQECANFRLEKERFIAGKVHHATSNGKYVDMDIGRYAY